MVREAPPVTAIVAPGIAAPLTASRIVPVRPRVQSVQILRGEHPLARIDEGGRRAGARLAALRGDPAGAGRDADLVAAAVVADDRAHRVGAVAVVVAGDDRGAAADVRGVVPVVVVVEEAAPEVAAIRVHEGRVVVLGAGVDRRHDDPLAAVAVGRPDRGGADVLDVPLDPERAARRLLDGGVDLGLGRDRVGEDLVGRVRDDRGDARVGGDVLEGLRVGGHLDRVHDPEGGEAGAAALQEGADVRLALLGGPRQLVVDELAAPVPVRDPLRRGEVRLRLHQDPAGRLPVLLERRVDRRGEDRWRGGEARDRDEPDEKDEDTDRGDDPAAGVGCGGCEAAHGHPCLGGPCRGRQARSVGHGPSPT